MDVRFCPYCGSPEIDTTSHAEGNGVESVIASCRGWDCGEECVIDRNVENDYEDEDEDPSNSR